MAYYRQPAFYRSFKCMGGKCPNSCCAIWTIEWSKKEVERLKAANCSPELRTLVDESFAPNAQNDNGLIIKLDSKKNFDCPFLTKDRMCRIQRELGEEYLSFTCTFFPRKIFASQDIFTRTCSASCYQVIETLYKDPCAMNLVNTPIDKESIGLNVQTYSAEDLKKHPELNYRNDLFEFFYEIISNKKRTIETSVVLGALAAQKLTEYISRGEHDRIPEIIKALRPQLNMQTVPSFENAKENYNYSLSLTGKIVDALADSNVLDSLKENGQLSVDKYKNGCAIFSRYTDKTPHFLRNLALNYIFEGNIPFMDISKSLFENYCYFASTIAATKLIGCAVSAQNKSVENGLLISISYFVRVMYHSPLVITPRIFNLVQEYNITTPAKIALMLK